MVVLLGSNFNLYQETRFGFIDELLEQHPFIDVYSIDMNEKNFPSPIMDRPNVLVNRICIELTPHAIENLFPHSVTTQYATIIVVDGINAFEQSELATKVLEHMKVNGADHANLYSLYYVSAEFNKPVLNQKDITAEMLSTDLHISLKDFLAKNSVDFQEQKRDALPTILAQINLYLERGSFEDANVLFKSFISGQIPKRPVLDAARRTYFTDWLNEQIASHIHMSSLIVHKTQLQAEEEQQEHRLGMGHEGGS